MPALSGRSDLFGRRQELAQLPDASVEILAVDALEFLRKAKLPDPFKFFERVY
jgi:hypothetical protein